jgi:hypothetical protein
MNVPLDNEPPGIAPKRTTTLYRFDHFVANLYESYGDSLTMSRGRLYISLRITIFA